MSASSDESTPARKKQTDMKDVHSDALSDEDADSVSGGASIIPCIKQAEPCIRPAIDPCWRPVGGLNPGLRH